MPIEPAPNIEFDDVEMVQQMSGSFGREVLVVWKLRGETVRELRVTDDDMLARHGTVCPACLIWRGQLVEMSGRRVLTYESSPGDTFTHAACPACLGLDFGLDRPPASACFCGKIGHTPGCPMLGYPGVECVCFEKPHRIHCPLGFRRYFRE